MKRLSTLSALALALAGFAGAQDFDLSRQGVVQIVNVADLPASDENGRFYFVKDGTDGSDCTVGGGSAEVTCVYDTTAVAWVSYTGSGGSIAADSIGPTEIDETANYTFSGDLTGSGGNWDFSGLTSLILPSTVTFGSGSTPFGITGFTDDVAPSAPGTANQFIWYHDRTAGMPAFILNGGSATLLETDTHASEHAENAADELLAENLGTACTDGQVPTSDGLGGLDCETPAGGSSAVTVHKITADSTFTCQSGNAPIGEVTFAANDLAVGDVLSFQASIIVTADTGDTSAFQYVWNIDANPLANTKSAPDTGLEMFTQGSCVIVTSTSALCWAQDLTTAGAPDGAAVSDAVTLNDITASSNTLGYVISSCQGSATATVHYNVVEQM